MCRIPSVLKFVTQHSNIKQTDCVGSLGWSKLLHNLQTSNKLIVSDLFGAQISYRTFKLQNKLIVSDLFGAQICYMALTV